MDVFMNIEGAKKKWERSLSLFSWTGPPNDQEDGKGEAAGKPQQTPELSKYPGVIWSQPGEQSFRTEWWAGEYW